jgi:hypothetical protein
VTAACVQDYAACKWPEGFPGAGQLGSANTAAWFDAAHEQLQQPGWSMLQQALQGMCPSAPLQPSMVDFTFNSANGWSCNSALFVLCQV